MDSEVICEVGFIVRYKRKTVASRIFLTVAGRIFLNIILYFSLFYVWINSVF